MPVSAEGHVGRGWISAPPPQIGECSNIEGVVDGSMERSDNCRSKAPEKVEGMGSEQRCGAGC